MNDPLSWRVLIYRMSSDAAARASITDLLGRVNGLKVQCTEAPDHELIVQCRNFNQARWVHRLVTTSDRSAVLVHQTAGMVARAAS